MPPESLRVNLDRAFTGIREARERFVPAFAPAEVGTIAAVSTGVATVTGLPGVGFEELIQFPGDCPASRLTSMRTKSASCCSANTHTLHAGDEVTRTGRVMDVGVGERLLGRVIDPLGRPLDGLGPFVGGAPAHRARSESDHGSRRGHRAATDRNQGHRCPVSIGRGQRELILGDRQTGKTAIAIDTILNQRDENVICIYTPWDNAPPP